MRFGNHRKAIASNIIFLLFGLFLCVFSGVYAGADAPEDVEDARARLKEIRARINKEEKKLEQLKKREESIFSQLRSLDSLVDLQRRKLSALVERRKEVEEKIAETDAEIAATQKSLDNQKGLLAKRFRRMYIDGPGGAMEVLLSARDYTDLARREIYYRAVVEADAKIINTFKEDLKKLENLRAELDKKKRELIELEKEMKASKAQAERKRAAKRKLLEAAREDRETHRKVLDELEAASRRIAAIIRNFEKSGDAFVGDEEPAESEDGGFAANAGRMCAPCPGGIVRPYGLITNPRFGTKTFNKGVALGAKKGTPVKAVWEGKVVYAGWFQGYGRMVILSHGQRYYTLYAHLSRIAADKGRKVGRGELIGHVGATGSLEGPRLYFEVRRGAKPSNPLSWISMECSW